MMRILSTLLVCIAFFCATGFAQTTAIKTYPSHWWIDMKNPEVQIMLHGKDIANANAYTINYPGITVKKFHKVENPNYVFIDLLISGNAKAGEATIMAGTTAIPFTLKDRRAGNGINYAQGVTSKDLMYLIMPDCCGYGEDKNYR